MVICKCGQGFQPGTTKNKSSQWPGHNLNPGPLDYCKYSTLTTQPHKLLVSFNEGKGKTSRDGSFNCCATHSSAQLHTLNCAIKMLFLLTSDDISYVCQKQYSLLYSFTTIRCACHKAYCISVHNTLHI